jgi:formate/nitrite transporter FocA (FNT family)
MISTSYRNANEAASIRLEELLGNETGELERRAVQVRARQFARIGAGVGGVGAVGYAVEQAVLNGPTGLTTLFMTAWPAMFLGALGGWILGRVTKVPGARDTGDALTRLAQLEEGTPDARASQRARALEAASIAWPMVALALVMPLTLHRAVAFAVNARDFDWWVVWSFACVGHAHVVLAGRAVWFAYRLPTMTPHAIEAWQRKAMWGSYGWTVLTSAIPGVIAFGLPPAITALTGLIVAPTMFSLATTWVLRDRELIA